MSFRPPGSTLGSTIEVAELETLTDGHIIIGDGSGAPTTLAAFSSSTGTLKPANGGTGVANNAASTLTISGNFATTLTVSGTTGVTLPTTGTLATLAGSEELTNKTLNASVGKGTWTASGTWVLPAVTLGDTVLVGGGASATELRFLEPSGSGTNYTALKAQAQGANITYTLPATVGAAGTFLTDAAGNGTLSWGTAGSTPRVSLIWSCETIDTGKIVSDNNASGTAVLDSGGLRIRSNTTSNGRGAISFRKAGTGVDTNGGLLFDCNPELIAYILFPLMTAAWDGDFGFVAGGNGDGPGASALITTKHIGFAADVVNGTATIYATNASGTTQTRTDITASITLGQPCFLRAVMVSGTSVKFYVNKTLVATHTTNLPSGNFTTIVEGLYAHSKNDAGETSDYSWVMNHAQLNFDGA